MMSRSEKLLLKVILPIQLAFFLMQCKPVYYIPNTQNVPAISSKSETVIALASGDGHGELQFAGGISKQWAVQANGHLIFPERSNDENAVTEPIVSGGFLESGLGYYKLIDENLLFEVYGLAGWGRIKNDSEQSRLDFPGTKGIITTDFIRTAIQPSITFLKSNWSASASARMARLQYLNTAGDLVYENLDQKKYLEDHATTFLFEPALTIRAGFDPIRFQLQIQRSFNLTKKDFNQDNSLTSLGFSYRFR